MLIRFVPKTSKNSLFKMALRFAGSDPLRNQNDLLERQLLDPEVAEQLFQHDKEFRNIRKIRRQEEVDMLHGETGSMVFKYDLPVVNLAIKLKNQLMVLDEDKEETQV